MFDAISLVFIATSLIVIITPGQDMVLVMSRSVAQGWKAGVVTAAGVSIGLMGHTVLATLGLGALLRTSAMLFSIAKLIGAAYLLYLGYKLLRTRATSMTLNGLPDASLRSLFVQGVVSNLSNPKVAIFYFAFLPQFVPSGASHPTMVLFLLGTAFAVLTFMVKGPIGYGAGVLSTWMRRQPTVMTWINRVSGIVLVSLGLRLAFEKRP